MIYLSYSKVLTVAVMTGEMLFRSKELKTVHDWEIERFIEKHNGIYVLSPCIGVIFVIIPY